ncbi:hypothetical protein ECHJAX_0299 [Ehrlichia chaffeensis str. Jax]|nr:hypothetical protein ECHJAX_0299 [Ehrlichia chaffeensis str. Jax]
MANLTNNFLLYLIRKLIYFFTNNKNVILIDSNTLKNKNIID